MTLRTVPAPERNKGPILAILRRVLPASGLVLEIASGTGQHVVHFARALPDLDWQPSDPDPDARSSIAAWIAHEGLANVRPPLNLDVSDAWAVRQGDLVGLICTNMIHIAPWAATERLIEGASRLLAGQGVLFLYGPFRRRDRRTAPSNESFDSQLRNQNPEWGIRGLELVVDVANQAGLDFVEFTEMRRIM